MQTVTKKLYTKHGLKTLEKGQPNYVEVYEVNKGFVKTLENVDN